MTYLLVETCSLHITLCNKNSCAGVQISITIRIQAHDGLIQITFNWLGTGNSCIWGGGGGG